MFFVVGVKLTTWGKWYADKTHFKWWFS